jgi:origin recognition complex subunit 2
MDTPKADRRQSTRLRQSVNYVESPDNVESPADRRKSLRTRTPNRRFEDIDRLLSKTPTKRKKIEVKEEEAESSIEVISLDNSVASNNDSLEKEHLENVVSKPSALFEDEEDVEGKKLYSFKTPKKGGMMAQLANQTPKTPRHEAGTPKTPKNSRISEIQKTPTSRPSAGKCTKTPRHVRVEMKRSEFEIMHS